MGVAVARAFAQRGARVVLTARRAELLNETATALAACGGQVEPAPADVTRQEDVDRLRETIDQRYGQLDLLCNCAGQSTRGAALETTVADFQQLLDVNFLLSLIHI